MTETFCEGVRLEFLSTLIMSIFEGSVAMFSFIKGGEFQIDLLTVNGGNRSKERLGRRGRQSEQRRREAKKRWRVASNRGRWLR